MHISFRTALLLLFLWLVPDDGHAEDTIVRFGHYNGYPPMTHGDGADVQGILVESLKEIFSRVDGYSAEFYGYPWARAQKMVAAGRLDAFCTVPTPARLEYTYFGSEAVWDPLPVAFYDADNPHAGRIRDIREKKDLEDILLIDFIGDGWGEANLSEFEPQKVADLETVFRLLKRHRADAHITPYLLGQYQINRLGMEFAHVDLPFFGDGFTFKIGIRKDFPNAEDLLVRLDAAITELREEGELARIQKDYLQRVN